ncbi:arylamine N-acetyltransferase family protein [Paraburkholderia tagetis]|uniref:Arylamine N-acetyltransferase n=1 Tax=Paraburkholderia tagetis TaxID=2913261 RepID=A0A9X1ULS5_9BURK|nr:arylamine N-acetyltransferase [Paraburkholderia tagetis]MCG5077745.1 arylamine N-acetyltransferase [Paraburkholderia tagetis]
MSDLDFQFDLDRYFARIGYNGERKASLDVLRALHRLHPRAIAFENLDPFAARPVSVALPDAFAKLVASRRGGYCFEHNTVLAHALMKLGFHIEPLAARVLFGRPEGAITPRTHMLLRVHVDGADWLADVGFGSASLCAPLAFAERGAQETLLEPARLTPLGDREWKLEQYDGNAWVDVYRFDDAPAQWVDYEMANWYTSASPQSFFRESLIVCIAREDSRAILFNDRHSERDATGQCATVHMIGSAEELARCLNERFNLDTTSFDMDALFARVQGRGAIR